MDIKILCLFSLIYCVSEAVHGKIQVIDGYSNLRPCTKRNQGEIVLFKDGKAPIRILICMKDNGVLKWSTVNTHDEGQTGEIFNPGYDCTSILDHNPEAKNGFYWITLNNKRSQKVWCDMKTDGGGYMLIGRKNNSVTWSVPSNGDPVEPFGGKPHWCSSFGDSQIVDFRVQMASKEDLAMTKSHWAYRLRTPRKLKELMINSKGCSSNSPGIGDILYVKNLASGAIVTTTFECSKFGIGHQPYAKIGWTMMNKCLAKPCPWGFAFHHKYPIQLDYSGSFSYSISNKISGIDHGATAFVGCSRGHCCGCHGPLEGKLNYCFEKCQGKNGGVIEPNVYTWFWVRTSVSKKPWAKCMDYKIKEKGVYAWYKLVGNSEIPIEGRCRRKNKAVMYDGMLVVSDNSTAQGAAIQSLPGMIVYRKDKKKLYVAKGDKLNALAEEKQTMKKIASLDKEVSAIKNEGKILNNNIKGIWKALNNTNFELKKVESQLILVGMYSNPGKSCIDILQRRKESSSMIISSGEYWILLDDKPTKVYCDMKADGGGWTLVSNIVLKHSKPFSWSLTTDYRKINEYSNNKLALSTPALRALETKMPYKQLRFFCHKKIPGRTFDIATKTNSLGRYVLQYFTAQSNTMPNSCGSYYRLSDDNSILASQCSQWGHHQSKLFVGKWHFGGLPSADRLFNHMVMIGHKVHWLIERSGGRFECDDFRWVKGYATSPGDFWKIFVR